ncbi:unnamed protein product [Parascedosporium putredinis]|uniref:Pyruvate carboxylase n=1 Tax=Parascedosporium putredinis TaxID=1442378 RepID=A0A9P1M864_9PEZI|nr:unnamed protein product [Parascedosporium putredinis]CAI7989547.1 unnamed protein product [Parascedosporium putredinis]
MSTTTQTRPPLFQAPPVFNNDGSLVIKRVLIANRGEIACRVIRTCKQQMMTTVAVFADEDENSVHVKLADEALCLGPADRQPYQNIQRLVEVAKSAKIDAIHPGYGYLSENADFARAVADAGIIFIGPTPDSILRLGDKRVAKEYLAKHSSVPLIPGYGGIDQDPTHLEAEADRIGYPVLIKASAGGGGKGMRVVHEKSEFQEAFLRCSSEAERSFGSSHCLIEKYIESGKHVEINPWLSPALRRAMSDAAVEIAALLKYVSAGTVEFIVDTRQKAFYFLEVNTRIQVEHPITEEVVGVDIVRQRGHSIEVRLCAENPFNNFLPCTGTVAAFKTATEVLGCLGALRLHDLQNHRLGPDRVSAIQKLHHVLKNTVCLGLTTNQLFLQRILAHPEFQSPGYTTAFIPTYETALLQPVDVDYATGPMAMAAILYNRRLGNATNALGPKIFRGILGHDAARELMVTRVGSDEFQITPVQSDFALTAAQKRVLFNKQGGALTRRFYHATASEPSARFEAKLVPAREKEAPSSVAAELNLQLGNERHNFYASVLSVDDFKREISVYSPHLGFSAGYFVSDALSWAGMFEQGKQGGGSSDAQRKYLSPMPCHILQVLAKDGTAVNRGDGLLVVESMKTEIRINAEAPGVQDEDRALASRPQSFHATVDARYMDAAYLGIFRRVSGGQETTPASHEKGQGLYRMQRVPGPKNSITVTPPPLATPSASASSAPLLPRPTPSTESTVSSGLSISQLIGQDRIPGQHISRVTQLLQESSETSPPAASDDLNRMVIDEAEKEQPAARTGWRMYPWNKLPSFIVPITTPVPRATADYLAANEAFAFPAMLLAAIPFVDKAACQSLGFASHAEARASIYRRTKLLYDTDVVDNVSSIAQDAWYWANCLTSFVEKTEPWRNIGWTSTSAMSPVLWWCCLVREAHVALVVRRPPRLYRWHKQIPLSTLQEDPTIIGDKTSGGDPLLRMRAASCLTLTARLVTIVAQILHTDFADIPSNSDNKSAIFESYRSKFETGPFFTVSLLMHDTAINALYLPRVLESRQPHSALAYKIPQYRERMRRAAIRTVVLITEAFDFTAVISALPVHMIGVNSKNREISMTSRRCIGTCVRFLHRVQSTYGMARHLQQDVLSTLSRMKVAPRIPGASGAAGGASSGSAAEPSSSSEGFAGYTLLGFRAGPRGPRAADPTLGEHTDGLSEASLGKRLLYEGGHAGLDDAWSSCGMDLLSVEDLAEMTQGLQGWFDDIGAATQQLSPMSS